MGKLVFLLISTMTDRYNKKRFSWFGWEKDWWVMDVFLNGVKAFLPIFIPHLWFSILQRNSEDGLKNGG